jgi:L-seryl-tRNA(Ser) seleniumtransferase
MKVGREEIVGMVKALELYLKADHDALNREWWRRLDYISTRVKEVPGTSTAFFVPEIANHVPHMEINWDPRHISLTPEQVLTRLKESKPSILLSKTNHGVAMNSFQLQPGEERIIADRLVQILRA